MDKQDLPGLTPAELERLACLAEELGEAIHAIGKVLRHGYESCNPHQPYDPINNPNNRELLEYELGHVRHWMIELCERGDLRKSEIHKWADNKRKAVRPYLHHQSSQSSGNE